MHPHSVPRDSETVISRIERHVFDTTVLGYVRGILTLGSVHTNSRAGTRHLGQNWGRAPYGRMAYCRGEDPDGGRPESAGEATTRRDSRPGRVACEVELFRFWLMVAIARTSP